MRRSPENYESSDFCTTHKAEYFDSCPECFPQGNGELVETLADIGEGISPKSWDNWLLNQQQDAMNQLDQDQNYINEVT